MGMGAAGRGGFWRRNGGIGAAIGARGSRRWTNTVRPSGLGWGDVEGKPQLSFRVG